MGLALSVCIPTYNREAYIGGCLESILSGTNEPIEIVVVDGASKDNTEEIVRGYQRRFPLIRYYRREKNVGVDEDILKVVELASGDYCWLMSDDDLMEHGAVGHVLSRLERYRDIAGASLNSVAYDETMSYRVKTVPAASGGDLSGDKLFVNPEECFSVLGLHLGYLSGQIIKRDLWKDVLRKIDITTYKGSNWLLVYIIGCMLRENCRWLYIHEPSVRYRSANDSFIARVGTYNRQLITHRAFGQVVDGLFGRDSDVGRRIRQTLLSDRMPRTLANMKASGASLYLQLRLLALYLQEYWRFTTLWWKVLPLFAVPNVVFRVVRASYLHMKSRRRSAEWSHSGTKSIPSKNRID